MNILWIPHNSWDTGRFQRDQYLIQHLKSRHQFSSFAWDSFQPHTFGHLANPITWVHGLRRRTQQDSQSTVIKVPRIPRLRTFPGRVSLRNTMLKREVRRLHRQAPLDVIVFSGCGEAIGIPSRSLGIPLLYDYVDWFSVPEHIETGCLAHADAVTCVSAALLQRAKEVNSNSHLITNGAQVSRFQEADGTGIRTRLGLENHKVVSLIGLTTSKSLYFIDAVLQAQQAEPLLKCLLVGRSAEVERRVREVDPDGKIFIYIGPVPYDEVPQYFAASDVGLYPGDLIPFFEYASPIKVVEYSAAGKAVVVPELTELKRMNFPNLVFAPPDADGFAKGILRALLHQTTATKDDLRLFDWPAIAERFENVLQDIA